MLEERHEIIEFSPYIPMKIFMHKIGIVPRHWHKSVELLFILDGTIIIEVDNEQFTLTREDIILINSNSIHEIRSEGAVMIALQLRLSQFNQLETHLDSMRFDCNSAKQETYEKYSGLRFAIASMIHENSHRSAGTEYKNYSLSYYLIAELLEHFAVPVTAGNKTQQKYMQRLTRIINYTNDHYKDNFKLNELAENEGLSIPYLSNFFTKYMGVNFSRYYTDIKLEHAIYDLINTTDSIETVALNHGFTEPHAFVRAFKNKYQMAPSQYRRHKGQTDSNHDINENFNYLLLEPSNYLHLLTKYLNNNSAPLSFRPTAAAVHKLKQLNISAQGSASELKHTFKKFISVGSAKDLLKQEVQEMLKDIQKNISYEFIKFHSLLSDEMMVCFRSDDKLEFRYTLVDKALDFLLSIDLKPLIQLSFMPTALASNKNKTLFHRPVNTSPPANMSEWNLLVGDFTRHLINRYGKKQVVSWLFCVWNEPTTPPKMFGFGNDLLFFEFYQNTYSTVKSIADDIQFGTPSILYSNHPTHASWIPRFVDWTNSHGCKPDFINLHYYSDIIPDKSDDFIISTSAASAFPKRTDDFSLFIGTVKKLFKSLQLGDVPIYLTEWNFTLSHRNPISDTCFKSCYILKNLLRNYDRLDSFGYWSLTDLLEENPLPKSLFHGGLGLYTLNGIRKSAFYAFYFANQLGDELLAADEGYFITRSEDSYQIITYNYVHYGDLFALGEIFDMTDTNRYTAFDMSKKLEFNFQITDLPNGQYELREYFVNREFGSAFDIWVNSGGIPLDKMGMDILKHKSVPGTHNEFRTITEHMLSYSPELEPLEIRLATIRNIN